MKRKSTEDHLYSEDRVDLIDKGKSYDEQVRDIKRQLKLLSDGIHPDYLKAKRKLDAWLTDENHRVQILNEHRRETISREYKKEVEACDQDFESEKRRIQDYLILLCEELKRRLESDKVNIELTPSGDILDPKPTVTRKLRRRAGCELSSASASGVQAVAEHFLLTHPLDFNNGGSSLLSHSDGGSLLELLSPAPNSGVESNTENVNITNDGDLSDPNKMTGQCSPSAGPSAITKAKASWNKNNLFGSLGFNLFEWGPFPHLLASVNHSDVGHSSGVHGNFLSYLYNLMCNAPSSSAAAAISAGVALSSSLPNSHPASKLATILNTMVGNTTTPSSAKKRRQPNLTPVAQLNLLLPETDIYADLTVIHRACAKTSSSSTPGSTRKHSHHSTGRSQLDSPCHRQSHAKDSGIAATLNSPLNSPNPYGSGDVSGRGQSSVSVWIDDGRLYCGQKCYQLGAMVALEGREGSSNRCTGVISAIGAQDVVIRRCSDHGVCRVTVQQLKQGRYALWPVET